MPRIKEEMIMDIKVITKDKQINNQTSLQISTSFHKIKYKFVKIISFINQ